MQLHNKGKTNFTWKTLKKLFSILCSVSGMTDNVQIWNVTISSSQSMFLQPLKHVGVCLYCFPLAWILSIRVLIDSFHHSWPTNSGWLFNLIHSILLNIMFHAPMGRFQLEVIYYFTYFSTVVPSNSCVFLSCRPVHSILLNIMLHAPMGRFQLELIYYFTYFYTVVPSNMKHTNVGWDDDGKIGKILNWILTSLRSIDKLSFPSISIFSFFL